MLTAILTVALVTFVVAAFVGLVATLAEDVTTGHEIFWGIMLWPVSLFVVIRGDRTKTEKGGSAYSRLEKQWEEAVLKEAGLLIKTGMHPHDAVKSVLVEKFNHSQLMLGEGNSEVKPMPVDKMYNRITGNGYY